MINAHTIRHLATLQPSVPAPSKRHLVCAMAERSREGRRRQRISFRFRSTEDSANLGRERREVKKDCERREAATSGGRELLVDSIGVELSNHKLRTEWGSYG